MSARPVSSSPGELALGTVLHEAAGGASTSALLATVAAAAQRTMGVDSTVSAVVLGDPQGELAVRAAAPDGRSVVAMALPEQLLLTGPVHTAATTGAVTTVNDLRPANLRWSTWVEQARRTGMLGVRCWPVRATGRPVGALVVATTTTWSTLTAGGGGRSSAAGQALADVCALVLQLPPAPQRWAQVLEHLHLPLQADVVVHQAVGMVAAATRVEVAAAGQALAAHARGLGLSTTELARRVVDRSVAADQVRGR